MTAPVANGTGIDGDAATEPRIGIALTRAYLPDASMRDLVSSAVGLSSHTAS